VSLPAAWVCKAGKIPVGPVDPQSALNAPLPPGTKTLVISLQQGRKPPLPAAQFGGNIIMCLTMLGDTVYYSRKFCIGPYQSAIFQADGFRNFDLRVSQITATQFDLVAMASDGYQPSSIGALLYPETVPAAVAPLLAYDVAPGAESVTAAANDPGFSWEYEDQLGATIILPQAMVLGNTYPVAGNRYRPSVPFSALWRIRP